MGVVINGLSMPKNCLLCPCCVGEGIGAGRQHYCQAIEDEPCVRETYRPKNCPLVEIRAPHGRLIDADYLRQKLEKHRDMCGDIELSHGIDVAISILNNAPTIIEAEVSE